MASKHDGLFMIIPMYGTFYLLTNGHMDRQWGSTGVIWNQWVYNWNPGISRFVQNLGLPVQALNSYSRVFDSMFA